MTEQELERKRQITDALTVDEESFSLGGFIGALSTGVLEGFSAMPVSKIADVMPQNAIEETAFGIGSFIGFAPRMGLAGSASLSRGLSNALRAKYSKDLASDVTGTIRKSYRDNDVANKITEVVKKHASPDGISRNKVADFLDRYASLSDNLSRSMVQSVPEYVGAKTENFLYRSSQKSMPIGNIFKGASEKASALIKRTTDKDVNPLAIADGMRGMMSMSAMFGISGNPLKTGSLDEMYKSIALGAFFGAGDRMIGALQNWPVLGRAVAGSIWNGSYSTIEGAPAGQQVFDYMTGFFFGAGEKPWHYRYAQNAMTQVNEHMQQTNQDISNVSDVFRKGATSDAEIADIFERNHVTKVPEISQAMKKLGPVFMENDGRMLTITDWLTKTTDKPFRSIGGLTTFKVGEDGKASLESVPVLIGNKVDFGVFRDKYEKTTGKDGSAIGRMQNSLGATFQADDAIDQSYLKQEYGIDKQPVFINEQELIHRFNTFTKEGEPMATHKVDNVFDNFTISHTRSLNDYMTGADGKPSYSQMFKYVINHEIAHRKDQVHPEIMADAIASINVRVSENEFTQATLPKVQELLKGGDIFDGLLELSERGGYFDKSMGRKVIPLDPAKYGKQRPSNWEGEAFLENYLQKRLEVSPISAKVHSPDTQGKYWTYNPISGNFDHLDHSINHKTGRMLIRPKIQYKDDPKPVSRQYEVRTFEDDLWVRFNEDPFTQKEKLEKNYGVKLELPEQLLTDSTIAQVLNAYKSMGKTSSKEMGAFEFGRKVGKVDVDVASVKNAFENKFNGKTKKGKKVFDDFYKGFELGKSDTPLPRFDARDIAFEERKVSKVEARIGAKDKSSAEEQVSRLDDQYHFSDEVERAIKQAEEINDADLELVEKGVDESYRPPDTMPEAPSGARDEDIAELNKVLKEDVANQLKDIDPKDGKDVSSKGDILFFGASSKLGTPYSHIVRGGSTKPFMKESDIDSFTNALSNGDRDYFNTYYKRYFDFAKANSLPGHTVRDAITRDLDYIRTHFGHESDAYKAVSETLLARQVSRNPIVDANDTQIARIKDLRKVSEKISEDLPQAVTIGQRKFTSLKSLHKEHPNYAFETFFKNQEHYFKDSTQSYTTQEKAQLFSNLMQKYEYGPYNDINKGYRKKAHIKIGENNEVSVSLSGLDTINDVGAPIDTRFYKAQYNDFENVTELFSYEVSRDGKDATDRIQDIPPEKFSEFIRQAENELGAHFIYSKSDSSTLIFFKPTLDKQGFLRTFDSVFRGRDDLKNHPMYQVFRDTATGKATPSPNEKAKMEFLMKQLPSNPKAVLNYAAKSKDFNKRLQVIGTQGLGQYVKNWTKETNDWREDWQESHANNARWLSENIAENTLRTFDDSGNIKVTREAYKGKEYQNLITAVVRDTHEGFSEQYKDFLDGYPDEPFDGIVFLAPDAFNNMIDGKYSVVGENPKNEFIKAFYRDDRMLMKAGFAKAKGSLAGYMKEQGIDSLVFDTSEKASYKKGGVLTPDGIAGNKQDWLTWTDPTKYFYKFVGHSKPSRLYKQDAYLTNMGNPGNDVFDQVVLSSNNAGLIHSTLDDPDNFMDYFDKNRKVDFGEDGDFDSDTSESSGMNEIFDANMDVPGIGNTPFGRFMPQFSNATKMLLSRAMVTDVLAPHRYGQVQLIIPRLPMEMAESYKRITDEAMDAFVPDATPENKSEFANWYKENYKWGKNKAVLGSTMADAIHSHNRASTTNKERFDEWMGEVINAYQNGDTPPKPIKAIGVRSPIASVATIVDLDIIGVDRNYQFSGIHPNEVKVIKGDHDGDKLMIMTDVNDAYLKFIRDPSFEFPADILDYAVTKASKNASKAPRMGALDKDHSMEITKNILKGKEMVSYTASSNTYRHMLIQIGKVLAEKTKRSVSDMTVHQGETYHFDNEGNIYISRFKAKPTFSYDKSEHGGYVETQAIQGWDDARIEAHNQTLEPDTNGFVYRDGDSVKIFVNDESGAMIDMIMNNATDSAKSMGFSSGEEHASMLYKNVNNVDFGEVLKVPKEKFFKLDPKGTPMKERVSNFLKKGSATYKTDTLPSDIRRELTVKASNSNPVFKLLNKIKNLRDNEGNRLSYDDLSETIGAYKSELQKYIKEINNVNGLSGKDALTINDMPILHQLAFSFQVDGQIFNKLGTNLNKKYGKDFGEHFSKKLASNDFNSEAFLKADNKEKYIKEWLGIPKHMEPYFQLHIAPSRKGFVSPRGIVESFLKRNSGEQRTPLLDKVTDGGNYAMNINALASLKRSIAKLTDSDKANLDKLQTYLGNQVKELALAQDSGDKKRASVIYQQMGNFFDDLPTAGLQDYFVSLSYLGIPFRDGDNSPQLYRNLWKSNVSPLFLNQQSDAFVLGQMGEDFLSITKTGRDEGGSGGQRSITEGGKTKTTKRLGEGGKSDDGKSSTSKSKNDAANPTGGKASSRKSELTLAQYLRAESGSKDGSTREQFKKHVFYDGKEFVPKGFSDSERSRFNRKFSELQSIMEAHPEVGTNLKNWIASVYDGNTKILTVEQFEGFVDYLQGALNKGSLLEHPANMPIWKFMFRSWLGVDYDADTLVNAGYKWETVPKNLTDYSQFDARYSKSGILQKPMSALHRIKQSAEKRQEQIRNEVKFWNDRLTKEHIDKDWYQNFVSNSEPEQMARLDDYVFKLINAGYKYDTKGGIGAVDLYQVYQNDPWAREVYNKELDSVSNEITKIKNQDGENWKYIKEMVSGLTRFMDNFYDGYISTQFKDANLDNTSARKKYFEAIGDKETADRIRPRNVGRIISYIPHRWANAKEFELGVYKTMEEIEKSTSLSKSDKQLYKKKLEKILNEEVVIDPDQMIISPFNKGAIGKQHTLGRNMNILGHETTHPLRIVERYLNSIVKLKNNEEFGARMIGDFTEFIQKDSHVLSKKEFGGDVNRELWIDYVKNYLEDNLDAYGTSARSPHIRGLFKRISTKLGISSANPDSDYYYWDRGDKAIKENWNKYIKKWGEMLKLSPERIKTLSMEDDQTLATMSRLEAKWRLYSLLAHPKAFINNIVGGGVMMVNRAGMSLFMEAASFYKSSEMKKAYDASGITAELSDYEFEMMLKARPGKDRGPNLVKGWAERLKIAREYIYEKNKKEVDSKKLTNLKSEWTRLGRVYGTTEGMERVGGMFMAKSEEWVRKVAFSAGYLKARRNGLPHDESIVHGIDFVKKTQFSYNNANRMEKDRSSVGRVLARFRQYGYEAFREHKRLLKAAKAAGFDPQSGATEDASRALSVIMMLLAGSTMIPYSVLELSMPPHVEQTKDLGEMLFGDDSHKAFFGTYGLSTMTSPTSSMALTPLKLYTYLQHGSGELDRWVQREVLYQVPFGRLVHSASRISDNPSLMIPNELFGIPMFSLMSAQGNYKRNSPIDQAEETE